MEKKKRIVFWLAMDYDGEIYAYVDKPRRQANTFMNRVVWASTGKRVFMMKVDPKTAPYKPEESLFKVSQWV